MSGLEARLGSHRWRGVLESWSLTRQFAVTGGAIMLLAMLVEGLFTGEIISRNTITREAATTALFMDSILSPLNSSLATDGILPESARASLDQWLDKDDFESRFPHLEIWKEGGLVAYSRSPELIGRRFAAPAGAVAALTGEVSARYTDLDADEHEARGFTSRYLEIYTPIREHLTGRIIAVAEIHEVADPLEQRLWWLRLKSWLARIGATVLIMAGLFWVVYRGNGIIMTQQGELRRRMAEIEQSARHNRALRERVQRASGRVAELTEGCLRRFGADLHDGPAQLIGLAALKVEHVRRAGTTLDREEQLQMLDSVIADALRDIRAISKGLVLPDIERLPLPEVVRRAARAHEQRTGTTVAIHCEGAFEPAPNAVKICAYRFVQEGLNNAFRHAGGNGQTVACTLEGKLLCLTVEDSGGTAIADPARADCGLGLVGLQERVESLGGTFLIGKAPGGGTRVEMIMRIHQDTRTRGRGRNG